MHNSTDAAKNSLRREVEILKTEAHWSKAYFYLWDEVHDFTSMLYRVRIERSEGLEYHQRTSHGQWCVEACYQCARTMSWSRDLMGFTSSLPQLVWD